MNEGAPRDGSNTDSRLRSLVERIERVEVEIADHQAARKDIYVEAKSAGYDPKIIRKLVAERKRDAKDVAEEAELLDVYRHALGM